MTTPRHHVERVAEAGRRGACEGTGEEDGPARRRRVLRHAGDLWGPGAQVPRCPGAQVPRCAGAQVRRCAVRICTVSARQARILAPLTKLPSASGTCATQEAGTRIPCVRHSYGMAHVSTKPGTVVIMFLYSANAGIVIPICSAVERAVYAT